MKIRRLQYNIDYFHILTFKEEYKYVVAPFFTFENVAYQIDKENTIHENIKLIFRAEGFALFIRKEGYSLIYEGDTESLKDQNGVIKIFWELFEKIKTINGFLKCNRHSISAVAVELKEKPEVDALLKNPPLFAINPFGDLTEFASIYEFKKNEITQKVEIGNYSDSDIKKFDISPFRSEYNSDLLKAYGLMMKVDAVEMEKNPNHSKFKSLLNALDHTVNAFKFPPNG